MAEKSKKQQERIDSFLKEIREKYDFLEIVNNKWNDVVRKK